MTSNAYWPGEQISKSGVYSVVHTNNHTPTHDVTILREGAFPPCNECGNRVYFTLTRAGQCIALNPHFIRAICPGSLT
jgi:hypothetical protein